MQKTHRLNFLPKRDVFFHVGCLAQVHHSLTIVHRSAHSRRLNKSKPLCKTITWITWNKLNRVGEAKKPGPTETFRIISGNVTALQPHIRGKNPAIKRWIQELKPSALALQEVRLTAEAQAFCSSRLPQLGLNTVFGAPLPYQTWLGNATKSMWNAIAGGTLVGAPAPSPIHSLPRDLEQEELYEFGRWTRAAIPIGAGHRTFHITSFYGPPRRRLNSQWLCRQTAANVIPMFPRLWSTNAGSHLLRP